MKLSVAMLAALVVFYASATVAEPPKAAAGSDVIDPDFGVYGVPFGASEKDLIGALGEPSGTVQLSSARRALLYGKTHAFIFRRGALRGLLIGQWILDWHLSQQMDIHPVVDTKNWVLKPGIRRDMSYAQVARALGRPESPGDYNIQYDTERAQVSLSFSGSEGARGSGQSFSLIGISIESDQ